MQCYAHSFDGRPSDPPSARTPLHSASIWSNARHVIYAWEIFTDWMNKYTNEWFLLKKLKKDAFIWCDPFWGGTQTLEQQCHTLNLYIAIWASASYFEKSSHDDWTERALLVHGAEWDLAWLEPLCPGGGQVSVEGNLSPVFMCKSTVIISGALKLVKGGK